MRRRGRGGGGARRPCAPRPELWAPAYPAPVYSPGRRRQQRLLTLCPLRRAPCAPAAGGLLSPWLALAPALRRPLYPTFPLRGRPSTRNPSLGCSWFPRAATKQRVPNFATSPVAFYRREPIHSAAQLETPAGELVPSLARCERRIALEKWRGAVAAAASISLVAH